MRAINIDAIAYLKEANSVRDLGQAPATYKDALEKLNAGEVMVIQHNTLSRKRYNAYTLIESEGDYALVSTLHTPILLAVWQGIELPV